MKDFSGYLDKHANRREAKRKKSREMVVTGRSIFVIQAAQQKRDAKKLARK